MFVFTQYPIFITHIISINALYTWRICSLRNTECLTLHENCCQHIRVSLEICCYFGNARSPKWFFFSSFVAMAFQKNKMKNKKTFCNLFAKNENEEMIEFNINFIYTRDAYAYRINRQLDWVIFVNLCIHFIGLIHQPDNFQKFYFGHMLRFMNDIIKALAPCQTNAHTHTHRGVMGKMTCNHDW